MLSNPPTPLVTLNILTQTFTTSRTMEKMDMQSLPYRPKVTVFLTCFVSTFQRFNKLHQMPALLYFLLKLPSMQNVKPTAKMVILKFTGNSKYNATSNTKIRCGVKLVHVQCLKQKHKSKTAQA